MIDLRSDSTELLLNPRLPAAERDRLERIAAAVPRLAGHVWIATSGSSGPLKLVALSKDALFASAAAVNAHLAVAQAEVWCRPLPLFHVGGLGIDARASLTGGRVVELPSWSAAEFVRLLESEGVALTALVPAQVADIVGAEARAPRTIRAIIVGGGALDATLYADARRLGWPLLPSFGMTEACSQVATAPLASLAGDEMPPLQVLSHLEVATFDGLLGIRGTSLLSGYGLEENGEVRFVDPKRDGWFITEDRADIERSGGGLYVRPLGRSSEFVKIGGEKVSIARLQSIVDELLRGMPGVDAAVVAVPDARLGSVIHLAVSDGSSAPAIREQFDARVAPYERAREVHVVPIPRSPLGKIRRDELLSVIP